MRKLVSAASAALLLFALSPAIPAEARDQPAIDIRPGDSITKTYPAFLAARPPGPVFVNQTGNPPACRGSSTNFCDAISINIKLPNGYNRLYFIDLSLSYDRSQGNNVALFRWNSNDPDDSSPADKNTNDESPKIMNVQEPLGVVRFSIINYSGTSKGYTLKLAWREPPDDPVNLGPGPGGSKSSASGNFTPPSSATKSNVTPSFNFEDFESSDTGRPKPTPRTVLAPGPDGELMELSLPAVSRGNRVPAKPAGLDPVVAIVVGVLMFAGAIVGFFAIRARRRAAA